MWTLSLTIQAIAWLVLIFSLPFAFVYLRKTITYLSYRLFPRDTIIQINENGKLESAYYVRFRLFGRGSIRELDEKELSALERRQ